MKIYISGQITGIESNAPALFESAESFLKAKGFQVVNPTKIEHNHDLTWASYMRNDIKALMECDGIYMLDNHTKSDGAKLELYIATNLKMTVFHECYSFMLDKYSQANYQLENIPQL